MKINQQIQIVNAIVFDHYKSFEVQSKFDNNPCRSVVLYDDLLNREEVVEMYPMVYIYYSF